MNEVFKGKTILVVDDEKDLREPLVEEFENFGCRVFQAGNGREAFALVQSEKIDVVISDIRMPGGDGIELLKQIKERDRHFPVVMLVTGFSDLSNADAYDLGAEAVLSKPFDLDDIDAAVLRLLTPAIQRWSSEVTHPPKKKIERTFEAFEEAVAQGVFALGRGGFFLKELPPPARGEILDFKIRFQSGEVLLLQGDGIVRWSRPHDDTDLSAGVGIEFEHLGEATRKTVLAWIEKSQALAFLPKGSV